MADHLQPWINPTALLIPPPCPRSMQPNSDLALQSAALI
jgi:hypothetical protein